MNINDVKAKSEPKRINQLEVIVTCSYCKEKRDIEPRYLKDMLEDGLLDYTLCAVCEPKFRDERIKAREVYEAAIEEISFRYGSTLAIRYTDNHGIVTQM